MAFKYNKVMSLDELKNEINKKYTEFDIYYHYYNKVKINSLIHSPFRDEQKPSFGLFIGNNNVLFFKDFAKGTSGDCYNFVATLFKIDYVSAIKKVHYDLILYPTTKIKTSTLTNSKFNFDSIRIKVTSYFPIDIKCHGKVNRKLFIDYFLKYNINQSILSNFKVIQITEYSYVKNGNLIKVFIPSNELAFAYIEIKDTLTYFKICRPNAAPMNKWFTNCNSSVHQGYQNLPEKADNFIITKSLKDVMSIYSVYQKVIPSIGMQAESNKINSKVLEEYKSRFKNIYCLFDNDYDKVKNWGQINAEKFCLENNIKNLVIPSEYKSTDFSELVAKHGYKKSEQILTNLINNK